MNTKYHDILAQVRKGQEFGIFQNHKLLVNTGTDNIQSISLIVNDDIAFYGDVVLGQINLSDVGLDQMVAYMTEVEALGFEFRPFNRYANSNMPRFTRTGITISGGTAVVPRAILVEEGFYVDADELSADNIDFTYWNAPEQTYDLVFKVGDKQILLRGFKGNPDPDEYYFDDPEIIKQAVAEASDSDFEVVD